MGYEDRMDAMSDYNSEQQAEGRCEVVYQIYEHFKKNYKPNDCLPIEEILRVISDFDG